jgi:teichuronic acid biosynthesis protein TuaE
MKTSIKLFSLLPAVLLILFFSILLAFNVKIASIVFAVILGIIVTIKYPGFIVLCAIVILGINTDIFTGGDKSQFSGSLEKIIILLALVPLVVSNQIRFKILPIIFVYLVLFAYTFALSSRPTSLDFLQITKTFAGVIFGWVIAGLILPARFSKRIQNLLVWLPLISIVIGAVLTGLGLWNVYEFEFGTGVFRLRGAQKAAQLASLSVIAIAAGLSHLLKAQSKNFNLSMILLNLGILVATSGRAALVMGVLIILYVVIPPLVKRLQTNWIIPRHVLILVTFFVIVVFVAIPIVIDRTFTSYNLTDLGINTSNRWPTWQFYWQQASTNLAFGRGLGANVVLPANATTIILGAPHNEYLRTIVDSGIVGLLLVVIGLFATMREVLSKVTGVDHKVLLALFITVLAVAFIDNIFNNTQFTAALGFLIASMVSIELASRDKNNIFDPAIEKPLA